MESHTTIPDRRKRRWWLVPFFILDTLILLLLFGPFAVPVPPLEGLTSAESLAGQESQFVDIPFEGTDGIHTHYMLDGAGSRNFLLLHGFGSNLYTWDRVFPRFAQQGRTLSYDRPAFGLSERLVDGDWTGPNPYAPASTRDQAVAVMNQFDMGRAVLVGNSAGGRLAVEIALAYPERVEALILSSPAIYSGEGAPAFINLIADTPQMDHLGPLISRFFQAQGENLLDLAYYDTSLLSPQEAEEAAIGFRVENWDRAFWEFTAASGSDDLSPRLIGISVPTLIIHGEADEIVPVEESRQLAEAIPGAELLVIPSCGHVSHQECDAAFWAAVETFLAGLDE